MRSTAEFVFDSLHYPVARCPKVSWSVGPSAWTSDGSENPFARLHIIQSEPQNFNSKMPNTEILDAILSAVDLDDPAQHILANRFMIEALGRVIQQLPAIARAAASTANRFITGTATAQDVIEERVRLWRAIDGRDRSNDLDVLQIRAAICVLYPMDICAPAETLEYFLAFWQDGGLGQVELEIAVENKYGIRRT